jgi:hypothetical protein
VQAGVN